MIKGKHILVVEDEPLVAMLLEDMLTDMGAHVAGPECAFDAAMARAEADSLDAAVLDVNLSGQKSFAVADILRKRGIPYAFATGYGRSGLEPGHENVPVLVKPYTAADVEQTLTALLG